MKYLYNLDVPGILSSLLGNLEASGETDGCNFPNGPPPPQLQLVSNTYKYNRKQAIMDLLLAAYHF